MEVKLIIHVVVVACLSFLLPCGVVCQEGGKSCLTPNMEYGECIEWAKCPNIYTSMANRPLNVPNRAFFASSLCAISNDKVFVCCKATKSNSDGSCATPDQRPGKCIHLEECASIYDALRFKRPLTEEDRSFMRRSQCGGYQGGRIKVCCPGEDTLLPAPGQGCGTMTMGNYVYGGERTLIDEFPWTVLLEYQKPQNKTDFHCGGILISNRYVLTAAHCVRGIHFPESWKLIRCRLGEFDLSTDQDCDEDDCAPPPQDIPVEDVIVHSGYESASRNQLNDIALIRLRYPATLGAFVQPICLHRKMESKPGMKLYVAGWGRTESAAFSPVKLKVQLQYVSPLICNIVYKREDVSITRNHICAGGQKDKDSCKGDSGSALFAMANSTEHQPYWFCAGIVSFGPSICGLDGWPGVYTYVPSYYQWILENMKP
ncbi:serine protease easter-like [Lutzomyia longipalpis]|uniref:serine protease easter-like n=1 Tax=Lutzomyia longipalpis TaxID=7200 RepID=UPI0024837B54|nr:serine protease easter-like [Lutzomyia longipalpis]